jgi:hypothetical protein
MESGWDTDGGGGFTGHQKNMVLWDLSWAGFLTVGLWRVGIPALRFSITRRDPDEPITSVKISSLSVAICGKFSFLH